MKETTNEHDIIKFKVLDFNRIDYRKQNLDEIIIDLINLSDGVYAYRSLSHLLDENDFIKWMKRENDVIFLKEVHIEFINHNFIERFIPENKENVYFIKLNKDNKKAFLENFKISITDMKNSLMFKYIERCHEQNLFIDDPLYDQYDFIFTKGNQVVLWTDIHTFYFMVNSAFTNKTKF